MVLSGKTADRMVHVYRPAITIRVGGIGLQGRLSVARYPAGNRTTLETLCDLPAAWCRALMLTEFERLRAVDIGAILGVKIGPV